MGNKKGYHGKSQGEPVVFITPGLWGGSFQFSFEKRELCALKSVDDVVNWIQLAFHSLGIGNTEYMGWQFPGAVDKAHVE